MGITFCRKKAPPNNCKYFIAGDRMLPLPPGGCGESGTWRAGRTPSAGVWGTQGAWGSSRNVIPLSTGEDKRMPPPLLRPGRGRGEESGECRWLGVRIPQTTRNRAPPAQCPLSPTLEGEKGAGAGCRLGCGWRFAVASHRDFQVLGFCPISV